jgi:LPS export ABC transporter protein LptC
MEAMTMRPHASICARPRARFWRVLACGALLIAGCDQRRGVGLPGRAAELPDQEVSDFVVSETDLGRVEWKLYAGYAATYGARNLVVVRGVRVDFYDEKGDKTSELRAREGDLHQVSRDMTARGDVVIQTTTGVRMQTNSVRFLNRQQKIVTDDFVRVERAGDVLTGYGFESDPGLEHFVFKRAVRAQVRPRPGEPGEPRGGGR